MHLIVEGGATIDSSRNHPIERSRDLLQVNVDSLPALPCSSLSPRFRLYRLASENVIVRCATAEDTTNEGLKHSLLNLINDSHRAMMADLVDDPTRYSRMDMEDLTERLEGIVCHRMRRYLVLLFVEGEIAGCCSVTIGWHGDPEFGHFGLLTVGVKYQRRGFGTRLATFAEDFCRRAGVELMQCEELSCIDKAVHPASQWLEDFYAQKLNFHVVHAYRVPKGDRQRGAKIKHSCYFLVYHKLIRQPAIHNDRDGTEDVSRHGKKDIDVVTCDVDSAHDSADAASPSLENNEHTMSSGNASNDEHVLSSRDIGNDKNVPNPVAESSNDLRVHDAKKDHNADNDMETDNTDTSSAELRERSRSPRLRVC